MSTENKSLIGLKYYDPLGRLITIVSEDPIRGPGYYLVERDDGTRWGVRAELFEPRLRLEHEESENASP